MIAPTLSRNTLLLFNRIEHFNASFYFIFVSDGSTADPCDPVNRPKQINLNDGNVTSVDENTPFEQSQNYPENYLDYADCRWHIQVDPDYRVWVQFTAFDVEDE